MEISARKVFLTYSGFFLSALLAGCAPQTLQLVPSRAKLGYETAIHKHLISLPAPAEPVVVAVYSFRDQTGQYKSSQAGMTWSTAVTQGGTSMLLRALEDSKWFVPLEREGLSNLLNERRIIRQTREQYTGQDGSPLPPLPPLMYAGITLEGGIISYESNRVTGGFGAKYFGLGGSTQMRRDDVTVYLRAVSTKNGRILKTVHTSKSILSRLVDAGLYRYVRVKRLLELESGYSRNEPVNMCVMEAIEKAVYSLIVEGVRDGLWTLADGADINSPLFEQYAAEKEANLDFTELDEWGDIISDETYQTTAGAVRGRPGFGAASHVNLYAGDYASSQPSPGLSLSARYGLSRWLSVQLNTAGDRIGARNGFSADVVSMSLEGLVSLFPRKKITPRIHLGIGGSNYWVKDGSGDAVIRNRDRFQGWEPVLTGGLSAEYFLLPNVSIQAGISNHFFFSDDLDGVIHGQRDDTYWSAGLGMMVYVR